MAAITPFGDYQFEFSGGALCLDFANTGPDQKAPETREEHLKSYADLLSWGVQSGELTIPDARKLQSAANHSAAKANAALRKGRELRQTVFDVFRAIAAQRAPTTGDLDVLNRYWKAASIHRAVAHAGGDFRRVWVMDESDELERPLWPVVASAEELLTSGEVGLVRECGADTCSWLFLDHSRNKSRRWCDMKTCGNRAKAKRYYEKAKS
jgi:predicted RNA-binding Zn ribbon-like protein